MVVERHSIDSRAQVVEELEQRVVAGHDAVVEALDRMTSDFALDAESAELRALFEHGHRNVALG